MTAEPPLKSTKKRVKGIEREAFPKIEKSLKKKTEKKSHEMIRKPRMIGQIHKIKKIH